MKRTNLLMLLMLVASWTNAQGDTLDAEGFNPKLKAMCWDIIAGKEMMYKGTSLVNVSTGYSVVYQRTYMRVGYERSFGGDRKSMDAPYIHKAFSLRLGAGNRVGRKGIISPYVGIGYQWLRKTNFQVDELRTAAAQSVSFIANLLGKEVDPSNRYMVERKQYVFVPVGVNYVLHGRRMGLSLGGFMNISKYQEIGFRVGLTVGKRRI